MNKGLFLILACILLFPALFVIVNPVYDDVDTIHEREGMNYYNVFDASQMGVPLERPMSQSLMDYSPTHYNWFDITNEYTSFPTLGDLKGTGSSSVDTGEIPLVPLNASIRADDIYAMFSVDNQLAKSTHILYHDGRDIYSATVSNSLYENTLEYGIDSVLATPNPALLVFSIWRMEGESEDANLYFPSARPDFKDVHFSHDTKSVRYYRNVLNEQLATFYVWLPSISGGDKLTIEYGESLPDSVADKSLSIPSPALDRLGLEFWDTTDTANWHPNSEFPAVPEPPIVCGAVTSPSTTLNDDATLDNGIFRKLSNAVANASDGDVLEIVGTHTLNDGEAVILDKSLKITGTGTIIGNDSTVNSDKGTLTIGSGTNCHIENITIQTPYEFAIVNKNSIAYLDLTIESSGSKCYQIYSRYSTATYYIILGGNYNGRCVQYHDNSITWLYGGNFTDNSTRAIEPVRGNIIIYDVNCAGAVNIGRTTPSTNNHILGGTFASLIANTGTKVYIHDSATIPTITGTGTVYVAIPPTAPSTAPPLPPLPARYNYDGETYILRADGKGDFTTLADAVGMASDGDIIVVEGEVEVPSTVSTSKSLKFTGTGTLVSNVM